MYFKLLFLTGLLNCIAVLGIKAQDAVPELLGEGLINTGLNERDFTCSADGKEAYFTRSGFNNVIRVIFRMEKDSKGWKTPEVASFSGVFNDLEPFLSPDGNRLFFASNRNADQLHQKEDYDIWYVERQVGKGWGAPVHLGTPINSPKDEFFPAVARNGNLYFTAIRDSGPGSEDIYVSEYIGGHYQEPKALDTAINSASYEFNAFVSPDENLILFSSYGRQDDLGGGDLYYSTRDAKGNWQPAVHLAHPINTESLDYCPFFHQPSGMLYYTSNKGKMPEKVSSASELAEQVLGVYNSYGNIYRVKYQFDSVE
jgi:hypothetical protein